MSRFLQTLSALLIVVLAALFAGPSFVDWNTYRTVFEEQATRIVGRPVTVEGDVNLRLLPVPYVSFEKVRIMDRAGSATDTGANARGFLEITSYTLYLAVPPLLQGIIEAEKMELVEPVLHLRTGKNGGGNWQEIGGDTLALPFVPKDVTLNAATVTDGRIEITHYDGTPIARLSGISGELSALGLKGPYKFAGTLETGGIPREVRWSTGRLDEAGSMRLKGTTRTEGETSSYAIDGVLHDLYAATRFDGQIAGKLRSAARASGGNPASRKQAGTLEMKAHLTVDATSARLGGLTVLFESAGRPQLIAGRAIATWTGGLKTSVELNSNWLDLDRMLGDQTQAAKAGGKAPPTAPLTAPLTALQKTLERIVARIPQGAHIRTTIKAKQVNLGGGLLDNAALEIFARNGEIRLESLKANLPGDIRIAMSGTLQNAQNGNAFDGNLKLQGRNFARFAAWLAPGLPDASIAGRGTFALTAGLRLNPAAIELSDAKGELAGAAFTGRLRQSLSGDGGLTLALQSARLDLRSAIPDRATLARWRQNMTGTPGDETGKSDHDGDDLRRIFSTAQRVNLELDLGQVLLADTTLNDLRIDIRSAAETLELNRISFTGRGGSSLELEGSLPRDSLLQRGASQNGLSLRFLAEAATSEGLEDLALVYGAVPGEWLSAIAPAGAMTRALPLRIAGTASQTARDDGTSQLRIRLDGDLGRSRTVVAIEIDGEAPQWTQRNWTIAAQASNPAAAALLDQLVGHDPSQRDIADKDRKPASTPPSGNKAGEAFAFATGRPASGMKSQFRLDTPDAKIDFNGTLAVTAEGLVATGRVETETGTPEQLAEIVLALPRRAPPHAGGESRRTRAKSKVAYTAKTIRYSNVEIQTEASRFRGNVDLDRSSAIPRLTISGRATRLSLPDLVSSTMLSASDAPGTPGTSGTPGTAATQTAPPQTRRNTPWSRTPFDLSRLNRTALQVDLDADSIEVTDGLTLRDAKFQFATAGRRIELTRLEGSAGGGRLTLRGSVSAGRAGVTADLALSAHAVSVATLDRDRPREAGNRTPGGTLDLALTVSGRGLSPFGLVSIMNGDGEIALNNAALPRFAPEVVHQTARDIISSGTKLTSRGLKQRLHQRLSQAPLPLGTRVIAIRIRDGALRVGDFEIQTEPAAISATTFVNLAQMKLDSEWRIKPVKAGNAPPLPPVTVIYAGDIRDLSEIIPRFATAALERELTVRRLEADVDRLEQLRGGRSGNSVTREPLNQGPLAPTPAQSPIPAPNRAKAPTQEDGEDGIASILLGAASTAPVKLKLQRPEKLRKPANSSEPLSESGDWLTILENPQR